MRRALHLTTAAMIAATSLLAVAADDTDCRQVRGAETTDTADDLTVCREDVWFHRDGTAGNLAETDLAGVPFFDTNAPEDSVAAGAGGGHAGLSLHNGTWSAVGNGERRPTYTPTFVGEFTGAIDSMLFDLYLFPPASMAGEASGDPSTAPWRIDLVLSVAGEPLLTLADVAFPLEDGGNAVKRARFAVIDIIDAFEDAGLSTTDANDVELEIVGYGLATNAAIWVYDTTEVPSGMVFNIDPVDIPEGVFVHDMTPEWGF